jgi:hypothetical protein
VRNATKQVTLKFSGFFDVCRRLRLGKLARNYISLQVWRMIIIANPIYDVVFKYLMEDLQVARIFLSALIGREVVELNLQPQEIVLDKEELTSSGELKLSVRRMDFAATIKTESGQMQVVLIELQKARIREHSMRFRKYVGRQYINPALFLAEQTPRGKELKYGLPILGVYILGEVLEGLENRGVVHVSMKLEDRYTKEALDLDSKMLRSLYHEGIIVSIPALKSDGRDDLETLMRIFDQSTKTDSMHTKTIDLLEFPEKFHPILRRLELAAKDPSIRVVIEEEDDDEAELQEYKDELAQAKAEVEEVQRQKEEVQRQKEEVQLQNENAILLMLRIGVDKQTIAESLGRSLEEIEEIETQNSKG